ncbi:hypothetical protein EDB19DRAFT_1827402 [Suillus lakei]|nr:hypothetical protein EDB19DRAFT_1827402 [Suillus lakei]
MAEEVYNPSETLLKAIISSVPIGSLTGVLFLLPILFTLPDVAALLQALVVWGCIFSGSLVLLGLIYLGSSAAFNAFAGVAIMCLGASYAMPVAISLMNAQKDMHDAPFNLGRFGTVINAVAVLWIMFAIVLFSMPAVIPVTRWLMSTEWGWGRVDYASVVFVGFRVISAVWYMINGQFYYGGPPNLEEPTSSSGFSDSVLC